MTSAPQFRGLGVAMVTPFKRNKQIDFYALERLTHYLIDNGVDYLVVQGTTGETSTLSATEKIEILRTVIKANAGRKPIVLGVGGNNTKAVAHEINELATDEVSAILSASPYYNKPTQAGIIEHYKAVAASTSKPIIVYNVPGRTASNLTAATTLRLANEVESIIGVKEASGNIEQKAKIIKDRPAGFQVISGDDAQIIAEMALGNEGVISVIGNCLPAEFGAAVQAGLNGNFVDARNQFYKLFDLIDLLFVDGNPAGVKAALHVLGICEPTVRLPLVKATPNTYKAIELFLKTLGK